MKHTRRSASTSCYPEYCCAANFCNQWVNINSCFLHKSSDWRCMTSCTFSQWAEYLLDSMWIARESYLGKEKRRIEECRIICLHSRDYSLWWVPPTFGILFELITVRLMNFCHPLLLIPASQNRNSQRGVPMAGGIMTKNTISTLPIFILYNLFWKWLPF